MWRSMLKVVAATAAFGVVHSLLASRPAKRAAERAFGTRNRNGWYRAAYNAQALATFGLLCAYIRRLPGRELYRVTGPARLAMHGGQAAGAGLLVWAASDVGWSRVAGLKCLAAWYAGGPVPPEPEAQGPAPGPDGELYTSGAFRLSRHPLNLSPLPVLWLWPRMTTNLLAFNVAATAYLIVGSRHEEARLREAYGERYEAYRRSGVPYYFPRLAPAAPHRQQIRQARRSE